MGGWLNYSTVAWVATWAIGVTPVMVMLSVWWWNRRWCISAQRASSSLGAKLPPGNMGLPLVGDIFTFLWYFKVVRRPDDFIKAKIKRYGEGTGMYKTYIFGYPVVIATSSDVVKFVLQSDDLFPHSWPKNLLMGTNNLLVTLGPRHMLVRKYISAAINQPSALKRIGLQVQPSMVDSLNSWADKGTVTAYDEVKRITCENIGKIFITMEAGPEMESMVQCFVGLVKGVRAQPINFPGFAYHYAAKCRRKLVKIFKTELEKRKCDPIMNERKKEDLMGGLMQIRYEDGTKVKDEEVIDTILILVVAGYEPTVLASMWAIYYLAKYPRVLQKLREENMAIAGDKTTQFVSSNDMAKMKYTSKVVEETLRMASISAFIFRSGDKEVEIQGNLIPEGWKVLLWLRYLHYDSKNYADPMCFDPDRWNKPSKSGTFQVFGGGSRICGGNMLARAQLSIFIHHLVVGFKWQLINPDAEINYLPNPIPVDGVKISISRI